MEYEMQCPRCRSAVVQDYKLISSLQAIVTTTCIKKKCKWHVSFPIELKLIQNEAPSIAMRLEHYGCVMVA